MKIKKISLSDLYIIVFFVIVSKCFYLINMPSSYGLGSNVQLEAICMIAFFVFYRFRICGYYDKYILFFCIFIVFECLFTMISYPEQTLYKTISISCSYFLLLGYFPLSCYCKDDDKYRKFITIMTISSLLVTIIATIFAFSVNFKGKELFEFSQTYKNFDRNGNIRVYYIFENYLRISQIVSLGWILQKRCQKKIEKLLHILNYILIFWGIVYIDQSRYYLFTVIIISVFMILKSESRFSKWIVSGLILIFLLIILSDTFISTVGNLFVGDRSFSIRIESIKYFFQKATNNPIFGMGLLSPSSNDTGLRYLLYGPKMAYFQDDVGVFGFLGGFGFTGVIWYIFLIRKIFLSIKKSKNSVISYALFFDMILSSFTMLWLDKQRIVGMLIALVIFDRESRIE